MTPGVPKAALHAIERIEAESAASAHAIVPGKYRRSQGIEVLEIGSSRVMITAASQSMYFNRVVGLGLGRPATERHVDRILEAYASRKVKRFSIPIPPHARPKKLPLWLEARGLRRSKGCGKLWRADHDVGAIPQCPFRVEEVGPDHAMDWWLVMSTVWPKFRKRAAAITSRVGAAGWRHYLAFDGYTPVACAAAFANDDAAHLLEGATLPSWRKQGAQSALIHRRVVDVLDAGARWLTSETAPPLPRMPLVSHRNLLRQGFQLAYIRPTWRREAD